MSILSPLVVAICFLFFIDGAYAWWDQGHQLVAAVARTQLTEVEIGVIDNVLSYWAADYPDLSNIVDAATWPDHAKCTHNNDATPFCTGMPYIDALEVFSDWHFHDTPYNPQNISLSVKAAAIPYPNNDATWALEQLIGYDPHDKLVPGFYDEKTITSVNNHPNRHVMAGKKARYPDVPWKELSAVSWNIRIRFLLHIFGDIHQPLHASTCFSHQFPEGDGGASLVQAKYTGSDKNMCSFNNLHAIWDAVGGLYCTSWPKSNINTVIPLADALIKKWPKSKYTQDELNKVAYHEIVEESFQLAIDHVYKFKEFHFDDPDNKKPFGDLPVAIDNDFIAEIKKTTEPRLALGGYRLAHHLKRVAKLLQDADLPPYPIHVQSEADTLSLAAVVAAVAWLTVGPI